MVNYIIQHVSIIGYMYNREKESKKIIFFLISTMSAYVSI